MTQKGVHFVPWFARRNLGERNRTASGLNDERQTDCTGRRGIVFGRWGGMKKLYICGWNHLKTKNQVEIKILKYKKIEIN